MVASSVILPLECMACRCSSAPFRRALPLALGFALVAIAGLDVYFLQILASEARLTRSLADDAVFVPEVSLALYLIPVMFGGIGVNVTRRCWCATWTRPTAASSKPTRGAAISIDAALPDDS